MMMLKKSIRAPMAGDERIHRHQLHCLSFNNFNLGTYLSSIFLAKKRGVKRNHRTEANDIMIKHNNVLFGSTILLFTQNNIDFTTVSFIIIPLPYLNSYCFSLSGRMTNKECCLAS